MHSWGRSSSRSHEIPALFKMSLRMTFTGGLEELDRKCRGESPESHFWRVDAWYWCSNDVGGAPGARDHVLPCASILNEDPFEVPNPRLVTGQFFGRSQGVPALKTLVCMSQCLVPWWVSCLFFLGEGPKHVCLCQCLQMSKGLLKSNTR